jgi:4-amino-4-deoxy-L-arabinose transferase-like glycosyltransferase
MKIRKEHFILIAIMLVGIIVRIIKFGDPAVGTDVAAFSRLGKNLVESGVYSFGENYNMGVFFPPGYPLFIAIINLVVNDLFFSAKLVSLISSIITIPVFYLIGREFYDKEAGLFAAFAYAAHPLSIILGVYGNSDALFFCLFFLAIYMFMILLKKDSLLFYLLIGVVTGLATNTRPEGMFICMLPFLHWFGLFGRKPSTVMRHLAGTIIMLSFFIIAILPYMVYVGNYTGKFALSGKNNIAVLLAELSHDREYHDIVNAPDNLYDKAAFTLTEDKKQLTGWNREIRRSLFRDYIVKDPRKFVRGFKYKVLQELKIVFKLVLPFLIPLLFMLFDRDLFRRRTGLIFVLFTVMYFFIYPFFVIIERQTFFVVLFPLILSSSGFVLSETALTHLSVFYGIEKNRVVIFFEKNIKLLIAVILIISSLVYLRYSSFDKVPQPVEHSKAGAFIRSNISSKYEEINIMSRKPIVSFYSDARFTMLPYANSGDVLDFALLYDVDVIVIDERFLSQWDSYEDLMHMDSNFNNVRLIYEDRSGKLIRMFEIKK